MNKKDFWKSVKEWNNKSLKDEICPNYVFKKWIFYACFGVIVLFALVIMNNHHWDFKDKFYFHCPEKGSICKNPYYNGSDDLFQVGGQYYDKVYPCPVEDEYFCNQKFFMPSYTYGEPKSKDISMFPLLVLCVFALGFIFNHILYNLKKKEVRV
jgi:hypothetical protein